MIFLNIVFPTGMKIRAHPCRDISFGLSVHFVRSESYGISPRNLVVFFVVLMGFQIYQGAGSIPFLGYAVENIYIG